MWIQPLKNKKDSCYIDTVLIALFIDPQKWVIRRLNAKCRVEVCGAKVPLKSIENIRNLYRQLAAKISNHSPSSKKTVNQGPVRNISTLCPLLNHKERFDEGGMNDPAVYLEFLLEIFTCSNNSKDQYPFFYLETGPLKKLHNTYLGDLIQKQSTKWVPNDHVILDLTRLDHKGRYVKGVSVLPEEVLQFGSKGHELFLHAIIVWVNFHYTVYAVVGDKWFFFDDTRPHVEKIGSYSQLLKQSEKKTGRPSPLTDSKIYFYSKMD